MISLPNTAPEQRYLIFAMPIYMSGERNRAGIKWAAESLDNQKSSDISLNKFVNYHDVILNGNIGRQNPTDRIHFLNIEWEALILRSLKSFMVTQKNWFMVKYDSLG
jgi:hypothetical protein